ncbi:CdaR family transcriptional regulator [Carbonactinospora thermoautotrophica]|nr:CdaR family transcriptional regulator [Carbonactinospora thermoautotrophica]
MLPAIPASLENRFVVGDATVLVIEQSQLAVVVLGGPNEADRVLPVMAVARLALQAQRLAETIGEAGAEVEALRHVATRILAARELEEALLSVTHEALRLLAADIAGVLLREGDEIVMRGCAGNRHVETARLRMRRGQGVAGLVFATGRMCKVDDYLRNDVISDDFHHLARAEETRSALGVPLILDGEVIGVLEVWRRRESVFTERETHRLTALADLATIALHNARLYEATKASLREVEVAHHALESQLQKVQHALHLQQELVQALIDGERFAGVVRIVAQQSGADVALLDNDFDVLAVYPRDLDVESLALEARTALRRRRERIGSTAWAPRGDRWLAVREVRAGGDVVGWLCMITNAAPGDESVEVAITQASLTCSLHYLEEQAATRARASLRDELLFSLVQGSTDERRAAVFRAKHINVDLRGSIRVCVCSFGRLEEIGQAEGWSAVHFEQVRRRLLAISENELARTGFLRLIALRGDAVVALMKAVSASELRSLLQCVAQSLAAELPGLRPGWGVSAPRDNPMELAAAYAEAWTATRALGHMSGRSVVVHEELGILGLLLAEPRSIDLSRFVKETIGPLINYDRRHGTTLVDTLRTYLDCDCSQQETATRLFVHQKTVRYRLRQIEKLTGLDLHHHHDRVRADVAVRAADLACRS